MSNYPAKLFPFYLIVAFFSLVMLVFCQDEQSGTFRPEAKVYREEGLELQQAGNIEEALSYYQKALILDPNYAMVYNDIGILLEARGQPEQAKYMYLKAIEVAPDYPNSYSNLALLYEGEKDYTNAILNWIKRASLGGPQDQWAEIARKRLGDIARIYPQAYADIGEEYRENLKTQDASLAEEVKTETEAEVKSGTEEGIGTGADTKTRALNYLTRAKKNFSKGEYVAALKDATIAEYLDSSNTEISAFVDKIRKAILR
jgi:tetratricopeptide (TPR) repeat protein